MEEPSFESLYMRVMAHNALEHYCEKRFSTIFEQFLRLYMEENAKTNLSAIRSVPEAISKHLADSLFAADFIPQGASVLDVGCGGGFPAVPLAIARTDISVCAVDATQKKIRFVAEAAQTLGLSNIKTICARVESPEFSYYREHFDVVIARAVANLPVLAELTLPFVRVGGVFIALKGARGAEEAADAVHAIQTLGAVLESDLQKTLFCVPKGNRRIADEAANSKNGSSESHFAAESSSNLVEALGSVWETEARHILLIRKTRKTPPEYPRAYAAIQKKPL